MPELENRRRRVKQWKWEQRQLWQIRQLQQQGDIPDMAEAFKLAIQAGRKAYLTGMGRVLARGGSASDPLTGFLR